MLIGIFRILCMDKLPVQYFTLSVNQRVFYADRGSSLMGRCSGYKNHNGSLRLANLPKNHRSGRWAITGFCVKYRQKKSGRVSPS